MGSFRVLSSGALLHHSSLYNHGFVWPAGHTGVSEESFFGETGLFVMKSGNLFLLFAVQFGAQKNPSCVAIK